MYIAVMFRLSPRTWLLTPYCQLQSFKHYNYRSETKDKCNNSVTTSSSRQFTYKIKTVFNYSFTTTTVWLFIPDRKSYNYHHRHYNYQLVQQVVPSIKHDKGNNFT